MPNVAMIQQEIAGQRQSIAALQNEAKAIRGYISANEHVLAGQPESLRTITQEGIARARANLMRIELDLTTAQQGLTGNMQLLTRVQQIESKQTEVQKLERDLNTIGGMLEAARTDLARMEAELTVATAPPTLPAYALQLDDGRAINLPDNQSKLLIGCRDDDDKVYPDIDLGPYNGRNTGVSRRHAELRWSGSAWTVLDLGSSNGTFVNETACAPHVPTLVPDGSRVRFGAFGAVLKGARATKTVRL